MRKPLKIFVMASIPALTLIAYGLHAQNRNAIGMEFVRIPAGSFMMGCSTGDTQCKPDENPRHRVQISRAFEIGKYEVTQAQWLATMQTNPSGNKGDTRPVETVSKLEAQDFIARLNAKNDGYKYRLPTEAEWEYAARAGTDAANSDPLDQVAWYAGNSEDETHPVGQKKPNAWGLYDMLGNVREWVSDFYDGNFYNNSPPLDPTGPPPGAIGRGAFIAPGGRGFQGPRGGGRGGPGGPGGPQGNNLPTAPPQLPPPLPPLVFPPGATQQQQIDLLRQRVEDLQQQLQEVRNQVAGGGFFGRGAGPGGPGDPGLPPGPPGFGPVQGPAVIGPDGQLIDPLDGLPTGLPVVRGGGWDQSAAFQRVSARYSYYGPTLRVSDIGFRVVREPAQ